MNISLIDIFLLISLLQGFIFGLVVLTGGLFRQKPNKYLAFSVIILTIIGMDLWLTVKGYTAQYYILDFFGDDIPWILLFYLPLFVYFLKITEHPFASSKKLWILTIPFFVFLLLNIIIDLDVDFGWINAPFFEENMNGIYMAETFFGLIFSICLWGVSYYIIKLYKKTTTEKKWLQRIWMLLSIIHIVYLALAVIYFSGVGLNNSNNVFSVFIKVCYLFWFCLSFFIYYLIYKGLYQFNLALNQSAIRQMLKQNYAGFPPAEIKRDTASKVSTADNRYILSLKSLMEDEFLYRDADLSQDVVAERLGISPAYLSQLINNSLGQNYTSFINIYRVKEVERMLSDKTFDQYSLLAIGMEAGFKSKSAFYSTFKSITGLTPKEAKNRILKS